MPILTGLAPDPRRPGHRLVELDRGRFASLPDEVLAPLRLTVGRPLGEADLARLRDLADAEAAYRAAVRALSLRSRARLDLRRRLLRRQHPPAALDRALDRLADQGLLDDARFAREYAAQRAVRGRGPARILRDLLAQGVERKAAESAITSAFAEEGIDPARSARAAAERRAAQLAALPPSVARRRLLVFLRRRGFAGHEAVQLVRELVG